MRPMRIAYLSHYFRPEGNAPAARVYEMTRRWAAAGHEVTVVTGVPNVPAGVPYPGYRNRWRQEERIGGVRVVRVWTRLAPNRGRVRRTLNYLSFMVTAARAAARLTPPDVLIATSPQFFCGLAGASAARRLGTPFVLEVRDLWPASIVSVGALRPSWPVRLLEREERRLYARARRIVTVGDGYRGQLVARGVDPDRIDVVPNGVDPAVFSPRPADAALRARYGRGARFLCVYAGTIGMACGLDVVLRAARRLRDDGRGDIGFLLVGDGAVRADLEAAARREGLERVVFAGRADPADIPALLAASDACLVHLRADPLFRTVLPSKIFEAAAMERPVVLGVEGHAARLVGEADAGVCIPPGDDEALARALGELAADPAACRRMGAAGRARIAACHDYDLLARRYLDVLAAVAGGNGPPPGPAGTPGRI